MITLLKFAGGLLLLVAGAEWLVRGASALAIACRVSPLVIGLTVVAYGTSAPELAVSVLSGYSGRADVALGNVVGSNVFNVLFILGVSALIVPLAVAQRVVRLDVPLMITVSAAVLGAGWDGNIARWEGAIFCLALVGYTLWCVWESRGESPEIVAEYAHALSPDEAHVAEPAGVERTQAPQAQAGAAPGTHAATGSWVRSGVLVLVGLGALVLGSNWLVAASVELARWMDVSELLIGLTIIAAGTSLPEVATSVTAALRGERDIAVGNVIGSNIFNILGVLGLAAVVAPAGIPVAAPALAFDIPVMLAVAAACLPVFFTGNLIARWEGGLFLGYYGAYTACLVLRETRHPALPVFEVLMGGFVLPLTIVTLAVVVLRSVRRRHGVER